MKSLGKGLDRSVGAEMRDRLFNKITPILLGCDQIVDSTVRMMIQSHCLDMVTTVEELIEEFGLDPNGAVSPR